MAISLCFFIFGNENLPKSLLFKFCNFISLFGYISLIIIKVDPKIWFKKIKYPNEIMGRCSLWLFLTWRKWIKIPRLSSYSIGFDVVMLSTRYKVQFHIYSILFISCCLYMGPFYISFTLEEYFWQSMGSHLKVFFGWGIYSLLGCITFHAGISLKLKSRNIISKCNFILRIIWLMMAINCNWCGVINEDFKVEGYGHW
jgi:hypothetical protein